jgi:hypothetical protein
MTRLPIYYNVKPPKYQCLRLFTFHFILFRTVFDMPIYFIARKILATKMLPPGHNARAYLKSLISSCTIGCLLWIHFHSLNKELKYLLYSLSNNNRDAIPALVKIIFYLYDFKWVKYQNLIKYFAKIIIPYWQLMNTGCICTGIISFTAQAKLLSYHNVSLQCSIPRRTTNNVDI